ncbi:MAG: hypothetical protein JO056_09295 [Alphaproteobacteria bacterium]|jgi:hypothetical protein|nr:hypothetical protein [Alphaproteobacteria bacterium]
MPPKQNPLKLNPLQLRSLAILQALAQLRECAANGPAPGEITVERFPQAHGDHLHLGDAVVSARDMTGLYNEKVWHALERKGLARGDWPHRIVLTALGLGYETGLREQILHRAPH